jgi:hypothetical protein
MALASAAMKRGNISETGRWQLAYQLRRRRRPLSGWRHGVAGVARWLAAAIGVSQQA